MVSGTDDRIPHVPGRVLWDTEAASFNGQVSSFQLISLHLEAALQHFGVLFFLTPLHCPLPREHMRHPVGVGHLRPEEGRNPGNQDREGRPDAVLSFLKSYGFGETHLASLITCNPKLLVCQPQTTLKPKMDFLIENGYSAPLLHELIVRNPSVLKRSVKAHLEPVFDFLRTYILTFDELHTAIRRYRWLLTTALEKGMKPNIEFLLQEGVTPERISKFIVYQPRAAVQSHERVVGAVESVKRMGLAPKSALFIQAVLVMLSMTEVNWNHKVEVLKSLGWSEEYVHSMFRRDPTSLGSSEEKIWMLVDFYPNTLGIDLEMIVK